jgi:hypothetical protein
MRHEVQGYTSSLVPPPRTRHLNALDQILPVIRERLLALPAHARTGIVLVAITGSEFETKLIPHHWCKVSRILAFGPSEEAAVDMIESIATCDTVHQARVLITERVGNRLVYSFVTINLHDPIKRLPAKSNRSYYIADLSSTAH